MSKLTSICNKLEDDGFDIEYLFNIDSFISKHKIDKIRLDIPIKK